MNRVYKPKRSSDGSLSDERFGVKLRVTDDWCVIFDIPTLVYIYIFEYIWRYGLPWHKVLNAVVAEQSALRRETQCHRESMRRLWFFKLCMLYIYIYIYIYDVVKSKRRHWLAVTLSFTPCGDRQTDFKSRKALLYSIEHSLPSKTLLQVIIYIYIYICCWRKKQRIN